MDKQEDNNSDENSEEIKILKRSLRDILMIFFTNAVKSISNIENTNDLITLLEFNEYEREAFLTLLTHGYLDEKIKQSLKIDY